MPSVGETKEAMSRPGEGWLECIGLSVRRDQFPELFEKLGSRHGSLNSAHFNLPSTPYTYIYAGDAASKIAETPPSLPGETVNLMPVSVPASPISNVAMEPLGNRQFGPEDTMPGTRVMGGAPGTVADTEKAYTKARPVLEATGAQYVDELQKTAEKDSVKALEENEGQSATEARRTPAVEAGTDSQKAQRAAAEARLAQQPKR